MIKTYKITSRGRTEYNRVNLHAGGSISSSQITGLARCDISAESKRTEAIAARDG